MFRKLNFDSNTLRRLQEGFVAFDTETTGLTPAYCRIIEVGAVAFRGGNKIDAMGTVVQSCRRNPCESINHIGSEELSRAPLPEKVYPELLEFFERHACPTVLLVGHNAPFDMKFLDSELRQLALVANIEYVDTLQLARRKLVLPNYKQGTIEHYFGLHNAAAHRAKEDAETCGEILLRLLNL